MEQRLRATMNDTRNTDYKTKLIEVALPLEAINREAAREKSIRFGHPSTLHLWWSRKPLAAARAVLFAQLVDDPSSHPELFTTEESQRVERERLHKIIERLVVWENVTDKRLLAEARAEITKSTGGTPPRIFDPFMGGGTIPLEAQRLGLEAQASDLNPVSVLITRSLVNYPTRFAGRRPVFPGLADAEMAGWSGHRGLAADVRAYGRWVRDEAQRRIGHLFPRVQSGDGRDFPVVAWLWARTVICTNPACKQSVPLISSMWLYKKKGSEQWLRPVVHAGKLDFEISAGTNVASPNKQGQGAKFCCWICGSPITPDEVHDQLDVPRKPAPRLLAIVGAGERGRFYTLPSQHQKEAADSASDLAAKIRDNDSILLQETRGTFGGNAQGRRYGFFSFPDYFSDRQLVALTTLSDLVKEVRQKVINDALYAGLERGESLESDGDGAEAYADAVAVYLALVQSKLTNLSSTVTTWMSDRAAFRETFARQAIPMSWEFAESNPLGDTGGGWQTTLEKCCQVIEVLPLGPKAIITQADAARADFTDMVTSTDPPYYDNIGYSDLSDYFYVWLRRTLKPQAPDLFRTMLVPKAEELVANSYRFGGKSGAKKHFEDGFRSVFAQARGGSDHSCPTTVYYAFKQSDADESGEASTGWETLLQGMIENGWHITATWPMRTESSGRLLARGTNALASSIVLSLRPRPASAPSQDRRGFIEAMKSELGPALQRLQAGGIAPVDLPQAAIGPGMSVFSRYSAVLEPDGTRMSVRSALALINETLDETLVDQEGDFDATTRFAIAWFRTHGYGEGKFGDADSLARARNTSVATLERSGILTARKGVSLARVMGPPDCQGDGTTVARY